MLLLLLLPRRDRARVFSGYCLYSSLLPVFIATACINELSLLPVSIARLLLPAAAARSELQTDVVAAAGTPKTTPGSYSEEERVGVFAPVQGEIAAPLS